MAVAFCCRRLFLARTNILKLQKRSHGYIVLLPEIGEDLLEKNPFISEDTNLPDFKKITFERCISAINKQVVDYEQNLQAIEKDIEKKDNFNIFTDLIHPLEENQVPLETTWGIIYALCLADNRRMPAQCYPNLERRVLMAFRHRFGSKPIFEACKNALANKDNEFTKEQERLLTKFTLEGRLNGLELKTKKALYMHDHNYLEIAKQQKLFGDKLEAKMKHYSLLVNEHQVMQDFPESFLKSVAKDPQQPYAGPWEISLEPEIVSTFLEYCSDGFLRKHVWRDNVTKCSLYGESDVQNSTPLEDIRHYRNEVAVALGYKSYAHMSMETKMAGKLEKVYEVFDNILEIARPAQERELEDLNKFAKERGFEGEINHWDVPYWARKQRRATFEYEENIVQEYFPLPKVLDTLFKFSETLFNIKIEEVSKPNVWHEDVRFFNVYDLDHSSNEPVANFYFDPYYRSTKMSQSQSFSWSVAVRNKSKICNNNPLVAVVFNFDPPDQEKPSLLKFQEVEDLFKKFGRAFQQMLTRTNYVELAGVVNVEWDAANISSYFMSNWVHEPSMLSELSEHYKTKEPLPLETINNLKNMRTFMAGYKLCKTLYLSRFDLELHEKGEFWVQMMHRLWKQHFVIPEFKEDSHICSFTDIFSGNFGAAYYGELWSEMIGADAFGAFQENNVGDQEQQKLIGRRYRDTFLALGGSCSSNEVFRRFRGRDPSVKALLKNLGLLKPVPSDKLLTD